MRRCPPCHYSFRVNQLRMSLGPVTLRPLTPDDALVLHSFVDPASWAGMSAPYPETVEALRNQIVAVLDVPGTHAFAVELDGHIVGRTSFYDAMPGLRTDVGQTIYSRDVWGGIVNPSAKRMLFAHAFDVWGMQRVGMRCDNRNTRSHAAIRKLGARYEGTLRSFRRGSDGSLVDVDYFSILREEWPEVRDRLDARIERLAWEREASVLCPA